MTLSSGNVVQGSFTIGGNSNLVSSAAASINGPVNVLYPPGAEGNGNGNPVELAFAGATNASYSVWASTNFFAWQWLGPATQGSPGQFEYYDTTFTNYPYRFYRISSP